MSAFVPSSSHLPSIELLLEPGSLDVLSAIELGAVVRILGLAWQRVPGCCVPGDERSLAAVARVTLAEWLGMQAQLLACMRAVPAESGPGLLSCEIARMHYQGLVQAHAAALEQRRRAGQASAAARRHTDAQRSATPGPASRPEAGPTTVQRPLNGRSTAVERPLEIGHGGAGTRFGGDAARDVARFVSSALERSDLAANPKRSSAEDIGDQGDQGDQDIPGIVATIHAGINATAEARLSEWRRAMSARMLEEAANRWITQDRLPAHNGRQHGRVDHAFIARIAGAPWVKPALVAIAIQRADEELAQSPMGYVGCALGCMKRKPNYGQPLAPYLTDAKKLEYWARLEEAQVKTERATAALSNVLARVAPAAPVPTAGQADTTADRRSEIASQFAHARQQTAGKRA